MQNKRGDKTCGKPGSHEKKSSCVTGETGQAESTNCRSESWPEGARTEEPFRLGAGERGSGPAARGLVLLSGDWMLGTKCLFGTRGPNSAALYIYIHIYIYTYIYIYMYIYTHTHTHTHT